MRSPRRRAEAETPAGALARRRAPRCPVATSEAMSPAESPPGSPQFRPPTDPPQPDPPATDAGARPRDADREDDAGRQLPTGAEGPRNCPAPAVGGGPRGGGEKQHGGATGSNGAGDDGRGSEPRSKTRGPPSEFGATVEEVAQTAAREPDHRPDVRCTALSGEKLRRHGSPAHAEGEGRVHQGRQAVQPALGGGGSSVFPATPNRASAAMRRSAAAASAPRGPLNGPAWGLGGSPERCAVKLSLRHALGTIAKKRRGIAMMPDDLKSPRMGAPCDPAPAVCRRRSEWLRQVPDLTKAARFREMRIVGRPRRDRAPNRFRGSPTCRRHQPQFVHLGLPKTWTGCTLDVRSGSAGESPSPRQPPGSTRNNSKRITSSPHRRLLKRDRG